MLNWACINGGPLPSGGKGHFEERLLWRCGDPLSSGGKRYWGERLPRRGGWKRCVEGEVIAESGPLALFGGKRYCRDRGFLMIKFFAEDSTSWGCVTRDNQGIIWASSFGGKRY